MLADNNKALRLPPRPNLVFRIGIVGHRPRPGEPFSDDAIKSELVRLFESIGAVLGQSATAPYEPGREPTLTLISSLAEGADQIAVDAFRAAPLAHVSPRLEVLLPFEREAYADTFDSDAGKARLAAHLQSADAVVELADWAAPRNPDPADAWRRDRRYATAGKLVMRQSDLLIAVWDGKPSRGLGGTADTVGLALRQGTPVVRIDPANGKTGLITAHPAASDLFALAAEPLSLDPDALAAQIEKIVRPPAPEAGRGGESSRGQPSRAELAGYLHSEAVPETCRWTIYEHWLVAPARRKVEGAPATPPARGGLTVNYLHQESCDPEWRLLPAGLNAQARRRLVEGFTAAWTASDAIATRLGHIYRSIYVLVFALGALAVFFGLCGLYMTTALGFEMAEPVFSGLEFLTLSAACIIYMRSHHQNHHARWMNARALSEQLRAHWSLALIGAGGRRSLGEKARWSAWLFNAYASEIGLLNLKLTPARLRATATAILDGVVKDQMRYHIRNQRRLAAIHSHLENLGHRLLIGAVIVCFVLFSGSTFEVVHGLLSGSGLKPGEEPGFIRLGARLFAVVAAILPALGGAIAAIRYQGDFERFSERSGDTARALADIETALIELLKSLPPHGDLPAPAPVYENLLQIVGDLERVLISDLDDWRFVYQARPVFSPG